MSQEDPLVEIFAAVVGLGIVAYLWFDVPVESISKLLVASVLVLVIIGIAIAVLNPSRA